MKAIMIIYNQAHNEKVEYMLNRLNVRGYTKWDEVTGRGSYNGEPRLGTHTWPEMNSSTLTIVDDAQVEVVLETVKKINQINDEIGIRAFVWNIEATV